jgi:hypothetical protein
VALLDFRLAQRLCVSHITRTRLSLVPPKMALSSPSLGVSLTGNTPIFPAKCLRWIEGTLNRLLIASRAEYLLGCNYEDREGAKKRNRTDLGAEVQALR